jgi:integrase
MGSVMNRDGGWVIEWQDGTGRYHQKRTRCKAKAEARRMLDDLERRAERQRLGLEPLPTDQKPITFGELMNWWWNRHGKNLRSPTIRAFLEKNLRPRLGHLPLPQVTADVFDKLLTDLQGDLAPGSLNHLRALASRMFKLAARPGTGLWAGHNPMAYVPRRKVPKRHPEYLRWEEVPAVLAELAEPWRWIVATSIYTGMRKGEVFGLEIQDVDLDAGVIRLRRSWDSTTVKDAEDALLPIAKGLRPHLEAAIAAAGERGGRLLYSRPDGTMHRRDVAADKILRRAMGRAGAVVAYQHRCRRHGCGFREERQGADPSRCPRCGFALYARPIPRHVRFHDLRHTTATLLLKEGVPLAVVQKVMRHSDPALTSEIYGHLDLEDMRRGLDRLTMEQVETPPDAPGPAPVLRVIEGEKGEGPEAVANREEPRGLQMVGATGFEPATTCTPSRCVGSSHPVRSRQSTSFRRVALS